MLDELEQIFSPLKEKDLNVLGQIEEEKVRQHLEDHTAICQVKNDAQPKLQTETQQNLEDTLPLTFGPVDETSELNGNISFQSLLQEYKHEDENKFTLLHKEPQQEAISHHTESPKCKSCGSHLSILNQKDCNDNDLEPANPQVINGNFAKDSPKPSIEQSYSNSPSKDTVPEETEKNSTSTSKDEKESEMEQKEGDTFLSNKIANNPETPCKEQIEEPKEIFNAREKSEKIQSKKKQSPEKNLKAFYNHQLIYNHNSVLTAEPIENIDFDENYFTRKMKPSANVKTKNVKPTKKGIEESSSKKKRPTGVNSECCICFSR